MGLYPRFRVLYQQSAIPYVAMLVFSCVARDDQSLINFSTGVVFVSDKRSAIKSMSFGRHT